MAKNQPGVRAVPNKLEKRIERELRKSMWFGKFASELYKEYSGEEVPAVYNVRDKMSAPKSVIHSVSDPLQDGGDTVDIPILARLTEMGYAGDAELENTGEPSQWFWKQVKIHPYHKVADKITGTARQRFSRAMLAAGEDYYPRLRDHLTEYCDGAVQYSDFYGCDPQLTTLSPIKSGQIDYITPYSHPNIYMCGIGPIEYGDSDGPGTDAYEDTVYANGNQMLSLGTDARLTAKRLRTFSKVATRRNNIMPAPVPGMSGKKLKICVMDTIAWLQLMDDPEWQRVIIDARKRDNMDNPFFMDAEIIWEGLAIYVYELAWGVRVSNGQIVRNSSSSNGIPHYGPNGSWIDPKATASYLDDNEVGVVRIYGPGAFYRAWGKEKRFHFTDWDGPHEQKKEAAIHMYSSFVRPDERDVDNNRLTGTAPVYRNTSSAHLWCFAPKDYEF